MMRFTNETDIAVQATRKSLFGSASLQIGLLEVGEISPACGDVEVQDRIAVVLRLSSAGLTELTLCCADSDLGGSIR